MSPNLTAFVQRRMPASLKQAALPTAMPTLPRRIFDAAMGSEWKDAEHGVEMKA